jgi:hypothetical protein
VERGAEKPFGTGTARSLLRATDECVAFFMRLGVDWVILECSGARASRGTVTGCGKDLDREIGVRSAEIV